MREIKFRVWDKQKEKMVYSFLIKSENGAIMQRIGNECYDISHAIGNELMQFTGLKDKNGKEIYEGDIVQPTTMNDGNLNLWKMVDGQAEKRRIEIKWDEKFAQFEIQLPTTDLEVIGNIYENPELLRGDK